MQLTSLFGKIKENKKERNAKLSGTLFSVTPIPRPLGACGACLLRAGCPSQIWQCGVLSVYLSFYSNSNPPVALYLQGQWFQGVIQESAAVRLTAVFSVHYGTCGKKSQGLGSVKGSGVSEGLRSNPLCAGQAEDPQ